MNSYSLECQEFTKTSFQERSAYTETQLEALCDFANMGETSKDHPRSTVRIQPSRLRTSSESREGENQDRNSDEFDLGITYEEYSQADLASVELYLDLMVKHDVSPYMIQVCGEWNAWDLKSLKGLNPENLALHCDQTIRMTRGAWVMQTTLQLHRSHIFQRRSLHHR